MRQVWQVTLDRLHVGDPNEGGLFSDGDEPQLAVIVFGNTFGRPGSTRPDAGVGGEPVEGGGEDGGADVVEAGEEQFAATVAGQHLP